MDILGRSVGRREESRELARSPLRRIGGAREFSTFAILVLCFAVTVGIVVERGHRAVSGAGPLPAASAHGVTAPNPSDAPVLSNDYAAWIATAAGNIGNLVVGIVNTVVSVVWDLALWLSNRILRYVADSSVNPVTGDRLLFNAAPGTFNLAVSILAIAMVAVVTLSLVGPAYASWKSWRLSRAHLRFRSH